MSACCNASGIQGACIVHAVKNIIFIFNASIAHRRFVVAIITGFLFFPTCQNALKKTCSFNGFGQKIKDEKAKYKSFRIKTKKNCFISLNEKYAFLFPFLIETVT